MSKTHVQTKNGVLGDDDFETEAPAPGASDVKYDDEAKAEFKKIQDRVKESRR